MATYLPPKKGVEFIFYVALTSQSSRPQFQANPTLASGDVKVSIDGGAFANLSTLPTVTPASGRAVKVTLSTSEMNGDNILVTFVDAAGAEWDDLAILIQTSARQIDDLAFPNTSGRGMDVDASGGVEVGSFQAGAITAAAIATDAIDADAIAADAVTEIQSGLSTLNAAGVRTAVGLASANLDTQLDALPTANENADALLDRAAGVETGLTPRQAFRLFAAALAGKLYISGNTVTIRNAVADSKNRITATTDADGQRTAVTTDVS